MSTARSGAAGAPSPVEARPRPTPRGRYELDQLRFLHQVLRLATTARTWDELLETVVDGTRDALHADVSSLYLLDRDGAYLTLAATNGLDRYQIGRARVPFGEGVTGRVAASQQPLVVADVKADPRFLWVRGIDQRRFVASMLSVPLSWHDQTVGVLNVQTERRASSADRTSTSSAPSRTCSPGIVEKGRQQSRGRGAGRGAQGHRRSPKRTHRPRDPRAADAARGGPRLHRPPRRGTAAGRAQVARPRPPRDAGRLASRDPRTGRAPRPPRRLDPRLGPGRARRTGERLADRRPDASSTRSSARSGRCSRNHPVDVRPTPRLQALADPPRLRQILEHLVENAVKYAPPDTTITIDWALVEGVVQLGVSDEGPGIPEEWRERIFEPYARRDTHTARGSGIGLYAAKRLGESMGARLWCEPARTHGARFVVALPAAVAV